MTLATKITIARLVMVPVFAFFALAYGRTVAAGNPDETLRWTALAIFITASASDALDGWVARRFNQRSKLGAFLDPLADKTLLLTGVTVLSAVDWGPDGWRLPVWFTAIVVIRDCVIIFGLWYLRSRRHTIRFAPHWSGKMATVTQMVAIGWVMLKVIPLSPVHPAAIAAFFTLISGFEYVRQGMAIPREPPAGAS